MMLALVKFRSSEVFVMAVSGEVGGVKVAVYWAVPLRIRREERFPA